METLYGMTAVAVGIILGMGALARRSASAYSAASSEGAARQPEMVRCCR